MNDDAFDASFLDVAANALAVVIVATMFALLTVEFATTGLRDPRFDAEPALGLRAQPTLPERPFFDYYLVFDGRIVRWDQERYVDALMDRGIAGTIELPGGKLRIGLATEPRDLDSFAASFTPDFARLADAATPVTERTIEALAAEAVERMKIHGVAPNYIVYPSGMAAFESLYRRLRTTGLWLRWYMRDEGQSIGIERRSRHFATFQFEF